MICMINTHGYICRLEDVRNSDIALAGGKAAHLGELYRIDGINVPTGFCISTRAFDKIIGEDTGIKPLLDGLSRLQVKDRDIIRERSLQIREYIEHAAMQEGLQNEITHFITALGEKDPYAIRSSATAEDLPGASFAGQQDTYLNIVGIGDILRHVSKCWASLFTERAIIYRLQNGFGHHEVRLAVVVQKMVFPQASGILFTADPVTSNRRVLSIEAGFGLGEALVTGLSNADGYTVREGRIMDKKIQTKKQAVFALAKGGTGVREVEPARQEHQALSDEQIIRLARIGRSIENHFGVPQDIEWCLVEETFFILQSRPITTLFPLPEANDGKNHVYLSVGHQQMMTDPIKPLGLSIWQLTAVRPMFIAGGRLFVDVAADLASPVTRHRLVNVLGKSDPLIRDALTMLLERGDFIQLLPGKAGGQAPDKTPKSPGTPAAQTEADPSVVTDLINRSRQAIQQIRDDLQSASGTNAFDLIEADIKELKTTLLGAENSRVIMAAMNASSWINENMDEWLGEKNAADILSQSVSDNITSEMGLALLDVADTVRPYPEIIGYLQQVKNDNFLQELVKFEGGEEANGAIQGFLNKYGMRCAGEIDITRTRWSEKPAILIPIILNNIKNAEPGASLRKFEQGRREAQRKEKELLDRLHALPDGEQKARETKRTIDRLRKLIGYREYPKYAIVNHYFIYKQAILSEARRLLEAGVIDELADVYFLTFEELREAVRTKRLDRHLVMRRQAEYRLFERLKPPRVMTSEGEIIRGTYKRKNIPEGSLTGLAVSSGVTEGRARVILNMEDAALEQGDILVTTFTDPSWTPLFVSIQGLVTEVGGLMTHGAVIAREYGLPAVVGVDNATTLIKDGQRIRVHGTEGYVELIS